MINEVPGSGRFARGLGDTASRTSRWVLSAKVRHKITSERGWGGRGRNRGQKTHPAKARFPGKQTNIQSLETRTAPNERLSSERSFGEMHYNNSCLPPHPPFVVFCFFFLCLQKPRGKAFQPWPRYVYVALSVGVYLFILRHFAIDRIATRMTFHQHRGWCVGMNS